MMTEEMYKFIKQELEAADKKVINLRARYKELENDIEYWERQTEALRTVNARLVSRRGIDE